MQSKPRNNSGQTSGTPESAAAHYHFRLYVAGLTPRSTCAIASLRALCEEHLGGRYKVQIFDLYQQPELARDVQIIAAPMLVKDLPPPAKRLIGDLSDRHHVLKSLDIASGIVTNGYAK
jgi:circadian clock protein KaiB